MTIDGSMIGAYEPSEVAEVYGLIPSSQLDCWAFTIVHAPETFG